MQKMNQKGFTGLEVIFLLVALVAIGAAGYFAYEARQATSVNPSSATKQEANEKPKIDTSADSQAALMQVKAFYKEYLGPGAGGQTVYGYKDAGYFTQKAVDQWLNSQGLGLTCSQNPLSYDQYVFSTPAVTEASATSTVTGTYAESGKVEIKLDLAKEGSTWKIDKWTCPN